MPPDHLAVPSRKSRNVSLRAFLKIKFPSAKTLIDLLPYWQVKLTYPLHSGEKQVIQGKQEDNWENWPNRFEHTSIDRWWYCTRPVVHRKRLSQVKEGEREWPLKDIGITMTSKALLTQTNVKVWGVWTELSVEATGQIDKPSETLQSSTVT